MLRRFSWQNQANEGLSNCATIEEEKNPTVSIEINGMEENGNVLIENHDNKKIIVPPKKRGMLDKLASGVVKNWKTRYFHLEEGKMTYFEPHHWYLKGEYDLAGLEFISVPSDPPEFIRMRGANIEICLRCTDVKSQTRWKAAIAANIDYANMQKLNLTRAPVLTETRVDSESERDTRTIPDGCCGWLSKKGQIYPSIKRRYFVLEGGMLSYYKENVTELLQEQTEEALTESTSGKSSSSKNRRRSTRRIPKPLGKFSVYNYTLYSEVVLGRIQLLLIPGRRSKSSRQMTIYFEDYEERDRWVQAFDLHSAYNSI